MTIAEKPDLADFLEEVSEYSGESVISCYQCGKCSAGCPMAEDMDLLPNQVMRFIQLRLRDQLLRRNAFWACVSCEACTTRCPKGIDIARVMDTLRILSLVEGHKPADRFVTNFNRLFLESVRKYGRLNELYLAGMFNLRTWQPFKDALLAPLLMSKGKIGFETHQVKDINSIEKIFSMAKPFGEKTKTDETTEETH